MERIPESHEQLERNLLTEPMGTIEAIAQVEGPEWMKAQEAMDPKTTTEGEYDNSLANALERLKKGKPTTIYGKGGLNRWFVEGDGSVSFSESLAQSPNYIAEARKLGFAIVP